MRDYCKLYYDKFIPLQFDVRVLGARKFSAVLGRNKHCQYASQPGYTVITYVIKYIK